MEEASQDGRLTRKEILSAFLEGIGGKDDIAAGVLAVADLIRSVEVAPGGRDDPNGELIPHVPDKWVWWQVYHRKDGTVKVDLTTGNRKNPNFEAISAIGGTKAEAITKALENA